MSNRSKCTWFWRSTFLSAAAQNACARFLVCCLKCCFWCLEKFIKFINRNAYIMVSSSIYRRYIFWILSEIFQCSLQRWNRFYCDWTPTSFQCFILSIIICHLFLSDCHLREKLLRLSKKRFQAAHEKHHKVGSEVTPIIWLGLNPQTKHYPVREIWRRLFSSQGCRAR